MNLPNGEEADSKPTTTGSGNPPKQDADNNTAQPSLKPNENDPMVVHHHAHHQGKKNWKSYFWEFLMLFLAVFCGFLAEYQLEHTIERDREQQYVESMMADMREDSNKIAVALTRCTKQLAGFDSLVQNIYQRPYTDSSLKLMYLLQLKYTNNRNAVVFTKRTITQLKNAGALRLIRNKAASDSIILYSENTETAEKQADYFAEVRMGKVNDYSIKLFDNQYVINYKGQRLDNFSGSTSGIALLSDDDQLMREYANALTYARGSLANYISMLKIIETSISPKLAFLADKYD